MLSSIRTAAAVALACAAIGAQAHNLFLKPSSTLLIKGDAVTVDASASDDLLFFDHPLALDGLVITAPDGSTVAPQNVMKGLVRSVFDLKPEQEGTYRMAVAGSSFFGAYKDAAGQMKRLRGTAEELARQIPADAQDLRVTETSSRAETFVTLGKPTALRLSGKGLELSPLSSPTDLSAGDEARFVFHLDGKPAANLDVVLVPDGKRYRDAVGETRFKTDANGQLTVKFPTAGMYWLGASAKDGNTSAPIAKERRLTYTATLEVLP